MSVNNNGNGKPPEQPHRPFGEANAQRDMSASTSNQICHPSSEASSQRDVGANPFHETFHPIGRVAAQNVSANPTEQTFRPFSQMRTQRDVQTFPSFHEPNAQRDGLSRPSEPTFVGLPSVKANEQRIGNGRSSEQTFSPPGQVRAGIDGNFAAPGQPNFLHNPMGAQLCGNAGQFGQPFLPFNPMSAQLGGNTVPSGQPFLPYAPVSAQLNGNPASPGHPFFPNAPMSPQLNANTGAFGPPIFPNALISAQLGANVGASGQPYLPFVDMPAQHIVPLAQPDPSYGYLLTERDFLAYQIHVLHQKCTIMEQKEINLPHEIYQLDKKRAELEFENAELQKECSKFEYEAKKTDNAYKQLKMEFECLKEKKRRNNVGKVKYLKDKNQTEDNHEENTRSTESPKKEDDKIIDINQMKLMLEKKNSLITMLEKLKEFNSWQLIRSQSHINVLQQRIREKSVYNAKQVRAGEHSLKLLLDQLKKHKQMIEYQKNFLQQQASEIHDQVLTNEYLCWKIMHVEMEIRQKDEIIRDNEKTIKLLQDQIKQLGFLAEPSSIQLIEKEGAVGGVPASPSEEGAVGGEEANTVQEYNIVQLAQALLQLNATGVEPQMKQENQNE